MTLRLSWTVHFVRQLKLELPVGRAAAAGTIIGPGLRGQPQRPSKSKKMRLLAQLRLELAYKEPRSPCVELKLVIPC